MAPSKLESVLKEMLDSIGSRETEFYRRAIELHNDQRLRSLAKRFQGIPVLFGDQKYEDSLYFTAKGFERYQQVFNPGGPSDDYGWYDTKQRPYRVEDGRLVTTYSGQKDTLLEAFPKLTIERVESALEREIRKHGGELR